MIPSPDGKPHIMKGMARSLAVVAKTAAVAQTAAVLTPDVHVMLSDYDFALSHPLTAGHHVVRITNTAAQAHELFLARLAPGKSSQDALAWIERM